MKGRISSQELGDWAFHAWYYYMEGEGKEFNIQKKETVLAVLYEISTKWELISYENGDHSSFPKESLKKWYHKLTK